jgi:class 3 adenylate cyclase
VEARFAETAHVLFIDLVGFSQRPAERQAQLVRELSALVRAAPEFQRAEAERELITLPTGDGMALVFFRYPLAPVQCAVEIARAVASSSELAIRMGIHAGAVTRVIDATGRENLSGDGLNHAQRVMDCGDAGHVLVSTAAADIMCRFEAWRDALHDLGECTVKHGERVRLYNLLVSGAGNPVPPSRLLSEPHPTSASSVAPALDRPVVALLYKHAAPDAEHLLGLLQRGLESAGYDVFIDRDLPVGVEWARVLRERVSEAYAVVPLLSAESIRSEMVELEVQTACEAQEHRGGLPRLLPVRVRYEGLLPDPLQHALGRLQYIMWRGASDDAPLVSGLLRALERPIDPPKLEPVGGAVPLDSRFYISRPSDQEFAAAMERRDSIVLVKGARQMGKTSLLTRGLQRAREAGTRCIRTDFQKLVAADLQAEGSFFLALAEMIADQLELDQEPAAGWNERRGGAHNFERFLRREVLGKSDTPHVWALDEVDRLFTCPFGTDVFALFRSWHNDRAYEPEGPWSRLSMAIAYATEAHLFITDVNQSPFNVGTRLTLTDFTPGQVAELNRRYGSPLATPTQVERFHALLGGQPYLTRRGLDYLAQHPMAFGALETSADQDEGVFGDHLRRLLVTITRDAEALEAVRSILRGEPDLNPALFYRLRSGGLLAGTSERDFAMRCGLYDHYLRRHLV